MPRGQIEDPEGFDLDSFHVVERETSDTEHRAGSAETSENTSLDDLDRMSVEDDDALLPISRSGTSTRSSLPRTRSARSTRRILRWLNAPRVPKRNIIRPVLPEVQTWPSTFISILLPGNIGQAIVGLSIIVVWLMSFSSIFKSSFTTNLVPGYNGITRLSCYSTLWSNSTVCGLNGDNCAPFDREKFAFSCPAGCRDAHVLEPHYVGNQVLNYQDYVIGGPGEINGTEDATFYRGDSFICPAAIHAGIVTDSNGGCGILGRVGTRRLFTSSESNGIKSVAFGPQFPVAFAFAESESEVPCQDPEWSLLVVSVLATVTAAVLITSPAVFFWIAFLIVHFQVALASEPPQLSNFVSLISTAFARLLPSAGVGFVVYHFFVRHTLQNLDAHFEKALFWVGTCWIGALNKYTFDRLPISRFTAHDIVAQPGAILTVVVIVVILIVITLIQIFAFRREGRVLKFLALYLIVGMSLLLLFVSATPHLDLRLHHYIIALLLLPGTSTQTRVSLASQGLLVGLFINGVARWDFASVLQTPAELVQDGGSLGSLLPSLLGGVPTLIPHANDGTSGRSLSFSFGPVPPGFSGISVLVNDVERWHHLEMAGGGSGATFNWTLPNIGNSDDEDEEIFFRFALTATRNLGGSWYADFSPPGTWFRNGTWVMPPPPPSAPSSANAAAAAVEA